MSETTPMNAEPAISEHRWNFEAAAPEEAARFNVTDLTIAQCSRCHLRVAWALIPAGGLPPCPESPIFVIEHVGRLDMNAYDGRGRHLGVMPLGTIPTVVLTDERPQADYAREANAKTAQAAQAAHTKGEPAVLTELDLAVSKALGFEDDPRAYTTDWIALTTDLQAWIDADEQGSRLWHLQAHIGPGLGGPWFLSPNMQQAVCKGVVFAASAHAKEAPKC